MDTYRTSQGNLVTLPRITASHFKNLPSSVFEQAISGPVVITRHQKPAGVFLSYAEFEALVQLQQPQLDELENEFDQLLARMQSKDAKIGITAAFAASSEELGQAAVEAARNG